MGRAIGALRAILVVTVIAACGGNPERPPTEPGRPPGMTAPTGRIYQQGMATFYGDEQGTKTASGERFDKRAMTAAHRTLPFGTRVRVTNLKNGRTVEVRINDRGPFGKRKRIIDVSEGAARQLGMIDAGVVPVTIEVLR
jgi:rare lipoprotein A